MTEQWKPIPSWSGYEASSEGRIRNADGQVLSPRPLVKPKDYAQVYVNGKASGRKSKMAKVAHLVAEAFIGPRPEGLVINHLDGVKENNRPSNLEYCTVGENNRHAFRIGLQAVGEKHGSHTHPERRAVGSRQGSSKLNEGQVEVIRQEYAKGGITFTQLAVTYGVDIQTICRVVRRQIWKHVA